eukprot:TRINITY_DN2440_c0_g1_i1.p1 TRINITY_DN2440_c0_g1~~TRINITY_DN2440_c0_g1_i1.p1  ORF type:complete len:388 (+),score=95.21 TRINITY_DN2440_c0_g1_i1:94-1257(+)
MSIPRVTILSDLSSIGPNGATSDLIREHVNEGLEVVGLFLFYERFVAKEASFWDPWIQILPKELSNTIFFNEAEMMELQGSPLYDMTEHLQGQLLETWQRYCRLFVGDGPGQFPDEEFTLERYKWSLATSWARTFLVTLVPDDSNESGETNENKQATAFIPLADLLNYNTNDPCGGDMDETYEFFKVWSNSPLPADHQLFIEYGSKGNTELTLYYGFALENNPFNVIKLAYEINDTDEFFAQKLGLIKTLLSIEPYIANQSSSYFEVSLRQGEPNAESSTTVLPFIRIHAIKSEGEIEAAKEGVQTPLSLENETAAIQLLEEKCRTCLAHYPTSIEDDERLLSGSLSSKEFVAVMARLEEKRMYRFAAEQARGRLLAQMYPLSPGSS